MNALELKAEMLRHDISIPKMAELLGMNKKTLYSRFCGATSFSQDEICKISKILNFDNDDIIRIFFDDKVS